MNSPLITMSALTGNPSKNDIYEYLHGLKINGIDEIMVYPRSGCLIEYLSERWFEAIGDFIKCAEELKMNIWLYDDFNWPSGDAQGRVSSIDSFRLKSIKIEGEDIGKISCKSRHNSDIFGEKFFPNLMSSEATDYFISCTHEEYYKRFKKYFGKTIKGIFTDEPSIGYCLENGSLPYYDGMENDYFIKYNSDFFADLYSSADSFKEKTMTLASLRFKESYIDKIASWCKEHGILMTGHLMCDNEPFYSVKYGGDFLDNLSSFSLPGIDEIATWFEDRTEMALFGAIEYASKGRGAMAELFALGPVDMSYAKKKCMIFLAAAHKIDHYFLAISHMDISGNRLVRDYFSNFAVAQPDFGGMRLLSEYAKAAQVLSKKDYEADLYIRFPTDIFLKGASTDLDASELFSLINELTYRGIQWKYITKSTPPNATVVELNNGLKLTVNKNVTTIEKIISSLGKTSITDKYGNTVKGIFRRRFDDGSFIILNLFAPAGEYIIDGKAVYLCKHAVVCQNEDRDYKKERLLCDFKLSYSNPNVARVMFLNDVETAEISANKETEVRIAVRNDTNVKFAGKNLDFDSENSPLPEGIRQHYNISKIYSFDGKTEIEGGNDLKYMPSAILIGDFSADIEHKEICKINLTPRLKRYRVGDKFTDYGKIEFCTKVTVPSGATKFEITGTTLYTTLYIGDELSGEKIAAPYIFNIDKNLWGKEIDLKIVQYSSLAPLFGDTLYWDKNAVNSQWRGTPSTEKTLFGFDEINWLY